MNNHFWNVTRSSDKLIAEPVPNNICRKTQESKGKITNFHKIAIVFPPRCCTCYWAKYLFFFYIFNKIINYNDLNKTLWIYWVTYTSFVTNRICAVYIELRLWLNLSNFLNDKCMSKIQNVWISANGCFWKLWQ